MTLMQRRRALMEAGKKARLPAEYQEVEWIGCTGAQYIDTGLANMEGVITDLAFAYPNISSVDNSSYVICAFGITACTFFGKIASKNAIGLGAEELLAYPLEYFTEKRTAHVVWGTRETSLTIDNISITRTRSDDPQITSLCVPLGQGASSRIHRASIHIYEIINTGSASQHLIPCCRRSDMIIGMYDLVSKTFYTNAGTGTFEKGPDVT